MNSPEDQKGAAAPQKGSAPSSEALDPSDPMQSQSAAGGVTSAGYEDGYPHEPEVSLSSDSAPAVAPQTSSSSQTAIVKSPAAGGGGKTPPPPPPGGDDDEEDGEDNYMLRMSFLEHLEELRS